MNAPHRNQNDQGNPGLDGVIKLAIMAVGGQGGGVLTGWIETLARAQGYACQATSVAGVAQRTGATIYYVEMIKAGPDQPVLALAPAAGDVDILIAAELMEAGRAIMRGFVTPDRTTLIASSHRTLAVSEKIAPGDGIANASEVHVAADSAAARFICFDMERLAVENGSVISATLFGALAASGCLPFPLSAFVDAIRTGTRGVDTSILAFEAAVSACHGAATPAEPAPILVLPDPRANGPEQLLARWEKLAKSVGEFPEAAQPIAMAGLRKVVDFMDLDYGQEYLDRVTAVASASSPRDGHALANAAAKYIANAMAYDDVIRVADRKTRATRNDRITAEMQSTPQQILHLTEYLHPRAEEIVGMLPARMGRRIEVNPRSMAFIDRWFAKGRRLRSDRLGSFMLLYLLGGLKRYRRKTHRHARQQAHLENWLKVTSEISAKDPELAAEVLCCGRLIKGYSDTHARGLSKFDKVVGIAGQLAGDPDAADWVSRLREAALRDEGDESLEEVVGAIEKLHQKPQITR